MKRESGENPLQPPLLYTATKLNPLNIWEGELRMTRQPGDLPVAYWIFRRERRMYELFWYISFKEPLRLFLFCFLNKIQNLL
ncbi:hypothetical protein Q428_07240 [Fervidicella metallireducens AeB]|uniref:Uncharacterized protein n=1 Tax=Fervidicella metallireducens AeB TaxID=1403537 RepID=A0A017RV98_9CLOT|nr:hypothetical protein Q428_07240 [Fervidicella metallireducens AeB]